MRKKGRRSRVQERDRSGESHHRGGGLVDGLEGEGR